MKDSPIYEDLSLVHRRAAWIFRVVIFLFLVDGLYYWKTQILDHGKYFALSEANRTRETILSSPRGVLTDRNGKVVLADNQASFRASYVRENAEDEAASVRAVAAVLEVEEAVIRERIAKYASLPAFMPIVVKDRLTLEEVSRVEGRRNELPELIIEAEPRRNYPFGSLAAHLLGYLKEVTSEGLRTDFRGRHLGDMVGTSGIEAAYESRLAGVDGTLYEVVDSQGRVRQELQRIEPRPRPKLALTIDYDLQAKAEELLAGKEGAVVILDPRNGEILALASSPTYDPNRFINRFTPEEWQALVSDPDDSLLDRAIQGLYSPGSLFKPVMALAGLDTGTIVPGTTFFCCGAAVFYDRPFRCWLEGGHGSQALVEAIQNSCNVFFYRVGSRLSIDTIARYAEMLGLGSPTGVEIPAEVSGLVPTSAWKKRTTKLPWYPGETISVSIGQGYLMVTPLQIAAMTATLANRGRRIRPHFTTEDRRAAPPSGPLATIAQDSFETIIEGMWRSVNKGGTGQAARVEGLDACGKTGSTQTVSRETAERLAASGKPVKTHSWFSGFGPRHAPEVVVTVLIEHGGMGGASAAPVAGQLFALHKLKKGSG